MYHNEGRQLIQTLELSQYLVYVERRLREEQARLTNYIDQSTKYKRKILIFKNLFFFFLEFNLFILLKII